MDLDAQALPDWAELGWLLTYKLAGRVNRTVYKGWLAQSDGEFRTFYDHKYDDNPLKSFEAARQWVGE